MSARSQPRNENYCPSPARYAMLLLIRPKKLKIRSKRWVDTHGHSPWHFTGQASLDLNAHFAIISTRANPITFISYPYVPKTHSGNPIHPRAKPVELCPAGYLEMGILSPAKAQVMVR
jgi:hypothetical protein